MSYTDDERTRLFDAAAEVLLATVAADRTGPLAYFREVLAAGRYLYDAQREYAHNRLVQQLFTYQDERTPKEGDERPLTHDRLLGRLSEVGEIVKDDEEGREFKRFLFDLALHIARASGGIFGSRISDDEAAFLRELRERLRMPEEGH